MSRNHVDPLTVGDAVEKYLQYRADELSPNTLSSHEYRLNHLKRWASAREDIQDTSDLTGRTLMEYRQWRKEDGDLSIVSLHTQMSTLRVFIGWLEDIEAIVPDTAEKVDVPPLNGQDRREEVLDRKQAQAIDEHLTTFQYGSRDHVLWSILYGAGVRIGGAHSLDVEDFEYDEQRLWFQHRPEQGTTLKNGQNGERPVSLSAEVSDVIHAYVQEVRPSVTDEHGRHPLIAGEGGRPSKSTLRRIVYRWTQPCQVGQECPHGLDEQTCETSGYTDSPSGCPSIVSPHAIRKRVIIDYREEEIPDKYISDRCNVNQKTMDKHYDVRSEQQKQEQRRDYFS